MIKLAIIIGLIIFSAVIAFYSTEGLLNRKNSNTPIFGRKKRFILTNKGVALALAYIGIIILSVWQHLEDENDKRITKEKSDSELARRDSLATIDQDRRDSISHTNTIIALARYGLKYDSTQRSIEKLVRDSSKMTFINAANPEFTVCNQNIVLTNEKDGRYDFKVYLCNKVAPSRDVRIDLKIVVENVVGEYEVLPSLLNFLFARRVSSEFSGDRTFGVNTRWVLKTVFIHLTGSYENDDRSKTFTIDELYGYEIADKRLYIPGTEKDIKIRTLLGVK